MRADEQRFSAAERNRQHMEQVRAIHRRSAYERVVGKIARYEEVMRAGELGLAVVDTARLAGELAALRDLRARIWAEMAAAGQVPAR